MTLEHSDFQDLFERLKKIIKRYHDDPEVLRALTRELDSLYRKIPIYPGIIESTLPKAVSTAEVDDLENGARVAISLKDGTKISGKFEKEDSGKLILSDCRRLEPMEELEEISVPREDVRMVNEVKSDLLAEDWPSLDFEVEE